MPYTVQFVGLACFLNESGARRVLLPDGREPADGVEPHYASIIVAPGAVESATGWEDDPDAGRGFFSLSPCSVSIQGADGNGTLDTTNHDGLLPQLSHLAPSFEIDLESAQTIARIRLTNGALAAYRIPDGDALMSQLDVPHDQSIELTVTPDDGSAVRVLNLAPGTEIAITNMARGGYAAELDHSGHFRIYEKLSKNPVQLSEPNSVAAVPTTPSRHLLFCRTTPIGLSVACSNTGCCKVTEP